MAIPQATSLRHPEASLPHVPSAEAYFNFLRGFVYRAGLLFYGFRRNDRDAFDDLLRVGAVRLMGGRGGDFFQNVITLDQFAERSVLMVEKTRVAVANEKLAAGGIRIAAPRHRNNPAHVRMIIKLGVDHVTGAASAPAIFGAGVLGEWIAALNHEAFDDAMEQGAVIKTLPGELLEIFDGFGRGVGPELDDHFARTRFNDGDFFTGGRRGGFPGSRGRAGARSGRGVRFGCVGWFRFVRLQGDDANS